MKPMLKPPGTKHVKLKCDILLSTFAFELNSRRYIWGNVKAATFKDGLKAERRGRLYTRPLSGLT